MCSLERLGPQSLAHSLGGSYMYQILVPCACKPLIRETSCEKTEKVWSYAPPPHQVLVISIFFWALFLRIIFHYMIISMCHNIDSV